MEQPTIAGKNRKEYMREYQRKRYQENLEKSRLYKNSLIYRNNNPVTAEEFLELGDYLANFKKIELLFQSLPTEIKNKLIQTLNANI